MAVQTDPPVAPEEPPSPRWWTAQRSNGSAVAALVCGTLGVVLGIIPILAVPALALGIVALAFGIVGLKRAQRGEPRKTMAVWGTILGSVAIALSIIGFVVVANPVK